MMSEDEAMMRSRSRPRHLRVIAQVGLVSFVCGAVCGGIIAPFAWQIGAAAGLIVGAIAAPFAVYVAQFGALNDNWLLSTLFIPPAAAVAGLGLFGPFGAMAAAAASLLLTMGVCAYLWPRQECAATRPE